MCKVFLSIFVIFLIYMNSSMAFAGDSIKVISRLEWGANEQYGYINSLYWKKIFASNIKSSLISSKKWLHYSEEKKRLLSIASRAKGLKKKKMNAYLASNFPKDITTISVKKYDGKNKLSWPITQANRVKNIVIHHTYSEYKNSFSGIKNIYKFHSLHRQWGDIGYNYIIGYDGEIFEGRAGGDYVIGAHDTWNNYATVGISIMGNYDTRQLSSTQYSSLKKLVGFLTKKYGINLNEKIPYHKECFGKDCPSGLKTQYYFPIVGHKDGKATSCPGTHLYNKIIPKLLKELQPQTQKYTTITYTQRENNKKKYASELNNKNWQLFRKRFKKLPQSTQNRINKTINILIQRKMLWKDQMFFTKVYTELQKK